MKTRILASIITGILVTSIAQADSTFSTNNNEVIHTCFNTSVARNMGTSGDLTEQDRLQQATKQKLTCCLHEAKTESNTDYFEQNKLIYECEKT